MQSGGVGIVIHFDCNPVYHFSKDFNYPDALNKVELVVTLSEELNETSYASNYALPINHNFESWGDFKTRSGIYSLQQPVISPIYNTRQKEAVLLNWMSGTKDTYAEYIYLNYIKANWEKNIYPTLNQNVDFKYFWNLALHDGVVKYNEKISDFGNFKIEAFLGITSVLKQSNEIGFTCAIIIFSETANLLTTDGFRNCPTLLQKQSGIITLPFLPPQQRVWR